MKSLAVLTDFFAQYPSTVVRKKELLVRAGDIVQSIYYVKSGVIKQYSISDEGQELTLHMHKPGSNFYLAWLNGQSESYYYFEAMTRAEVIKAPVAELKVFISQHPGVLEEVNERVFRGIDQVLFRLETLAFGSATTKVAAALLLLAKRFGKTSAAGRVIELPLTHHELALFCALTRETVSMEMSNLKKQGAVDRINGQVVIKDEAFLRSQVPYQVDR